MDQIYIGPRGPGLPFGASFPGLFRIKIDYILIGRESILYSNLFNITFFLSKPISLRIFKITFYFVRVYKRNWAISD
jgi:hypothetical protein